MWVKQDAKIFVFYNEHLQLYLSYSWTLLINFLKSNLLIEVLLTYANLSHFVPLRVEYTLTYHKQELLSNK